MYYTFIIINNRWLALACVRVGYPVLCMRFGAKFWMSDLAHAVYDSVYFYYVRLSYVTRLRELPYVIGLCEVAFIKSIQSIIV